MPKASSSAVRSWVKRLGGAMKAQPAPVPAAASAVPPIPTNVVQLDPVRPVAAQPGLPPAPPLLPVTPAEQLSMEVSTLQSNALDLCEYEETLRTVEAALKAAEAARKPHANLDAWKAELNQVKATPFPDPAKLAKPSLAWRNATISLQALNEEIETASAKKKVSSKQPSLEDAREEDKRQNERLASLTLSPKREPNESDDDYEARLTAHSDKIAAENGTASLQDRLDRLAEAKALLTNPEPKVQKHTALLLYRAASLGMGDCEPLLVQYATELTKRDASGKACGDLAKLTSMATLLCKRMVAKDLFGRYIGTDTTGSAAVEKISKEDANRFYFWSYSEDKVDEKLATQKFDAPSVATRLERTPAGGLFDGLEFGLGWSSEHFRTSFTAISGDYATKALQRAKEQGKKRSILITAYRGFNADSVLGNTEWPKLKAEILTQKLAFRFDAYCWDGEPMAGKWDAKSAGFRSSEFKSVAFPSKTIFKTYKDVAAAEATAWDFRKNDDVMKCGGLHKKGKGKGHAFASIPVAFYGKQLVGLNEKGHIVLMKSDGSLGESTNLREADFLAREAVKQVP